MSTPIYAATPQERLEQLYADMLSEHPKGLSSTSSNKFDEIQEFFANLIQLPKSDVYVVGARTRTSNLEVRLSQGVQATMHTRLGVGFVSATNDEEAKRNVASALKTVDKFIGRSKANYDAVALVVVVDQKPRVAAVIESEASDLGDRLLAHFPALERTRRSNPVVEGPAGATPRPLGASHGSLKAMDIADAFSWAVRELGFVSAAALPERLVVALLTKPFVVMSGLSGSGKTRLAIALAQWLSPADPSKRKYEIVPVGSDWSNRDPILGFRDALDPERYRRTPALNLLLRAVADPGSPHFLILDEMNLSHVERYFSDFLSSMETGEAIHLHDGEDSVDGVPTHLTGIPPNVFIIGTINVDETTYLFSPKVLDRANVLEHLVDAEDLQTYLGGSLTVDWSRLTGAGVPYAEAFCSLAVADVWPSDGTRSVLADEIALLAGPFARAGFGLGFRTAREVARFVGLGCPKEDGQQLRSCIDWQIYQKLLPKLHGSRSRLERLLRECRVLVTENHEWSLNGTPGGLLNGGSLEAACASAMDPLAEPPPPAPMFPLAAEKIDRMLELLERDGFTSFSEG